jgi:hypothetical protein
MVLVALLLTTKFFWSPYEWRPKMGFGHHLRNLDSWMATKKIWLPMTKFGKGVCNMFLESFH